MPGEHARSLNLAQAVAVAAYELHRQTQVAVFVTATADDLGDIADLANRIWPSAYAGIIPDVQIRYMLDEYYSARQLQADVRDGVRFVYVVVDRRRVGFFAFGPSEREGEALLHKVYLLPECHGRGIGSAMLREALRQAREAGYRSVSLYVNRRNARAIRAYERNGFRMRGEVVTSIGHGFVKDDYLMECDLG
jgi:ribosomal protein S18 acetylase RimI-like enzyme